MGDLERRESIGFILQTLSGLDELKRWLHWKCWHGADLGKQDSSSSGSSLELVPCWVKCISIKLHRFDRNLLDSHHSSTQPGGNALLCLTTRWDSLSISMAMITFFPPPPIKPQKMSERIPVVHVSGNHPELRCRGICFWTVGEGQSQSKCCCYLGHESPVFGFEVQVEWYSNGWRCNQVLLGYLVSRIKNQIM